VTGLRNRASRSADLRLVTYADELAQLLPAPEREADLLGFSAPVELTCSYGELRLLTTLTSFATATDVTLAELHLEAFLPADEHSATLLRAGRHVLVNAMRDASAEVEDRRA
jgi:hypothetical protein